MARDATERQHGEDDHQAVLQVNGLTYNDLKTSFVSYTDAVAQVQDGHAVAFTLGTTIPSGAVMDLASARDIKLLDLSDSLRRCASSIPATRSSRFRRAPIRSRTRT